MDASGNLDLYEEVAQKGYFDIDFRQGNLVVKATRFVGLIPLSDKVAIQVSPKAPIGNLLYLVARSGLQVRGIERFIRGYQTDRQVKNIEEVYAESFLSALSSLRRIGPMRQYRSRATDRELRGRLLFSESVKRNYATGTRRHPVFDVTDFTSDIEENRILKKTAERLKRHFLQRGGKKAFIVAKELDLVIQTLGASGTSSIVPQDVVRRIPIMLRRLPTSHRFYEPALWLSYLIALNRAVRMDEIGPTKFETIVLDVSAVFEEYVRRLLLEARSGSFAGIEVVDGNKVPVPLFVRGVSHPTHPDYYFRRGGAVFALADAKYKSDPTAQDRYEVLAFCEALGVQRAVIICPRIQSEPRVSHHGTTRSGRVMTIIRIDLASNDLNDEEQIFIAALAQTFEITPNRA
jgi:5-methylcytosine-specific restriction endonuclease McrBC regulatory subunit McrC